MILKSLTIAVGTALSIAAAAPAFSYDSSWYDSNWDVPRPRDLAAQPVAPTANVPAQAAPGTAVANQAATRTVVLGPNVKYVNVVQGEAVKFVAGSQAFTYRFDTMNTPRFALKEIAPKGFPGADVQVFVEHDPAHMGG